MLRFTRGPWFIEPIDDPKKFKLPGGKPIYQVMATNEHGEAMTVCTIEEYQEVNTPQDRAADAALISQAPDMLECLMALVEEGTDSPIHNRAMQVIARARTPYGKHPDMP